MTRWELNDIIGWVLRLSQVSRLAAVTGFGKNEITELRKTAQRDSETLADGIKEEMKYRLFFVSIGNVHNKRIRYENYVSRLELPQLSLLICMGNF